MIKIMWCEDRMWRSNEELIIAFVFPLSSTWVWGYRCHIGLLHVIILIHAYDKFGEHIYVCLFHHTCKHRSNSVWSLHAHGMGVCMSGCVFSVILLHNYFIKICDYFTKPYNWKTLLGFFTRVVVIHVVTYPCSNIGTDTDTDQSQDSSLLTFRGMTIQVNTGK